MPVEVEVKIKVDDFEEIEFKLLDSGALLEEIVMQRDHYFQHPSRDFNETDEALRIREDGDRFYLTYKGPKFDPRSKTRIELNTEITSIKNITHTLEQLGFQEVGIVPKERKIYLYNELQFCLDNVESVGLYVEVEKTIEDKSNYEIELEFIFKTIKEMGLNPENNERKSYLELFLEKTKIKKK
ncbi:MAG: class IV adenylate cyclase [Candidatus Heimdallarchaeota archaeon]|nr:class IV adenylate cyclase [Candidatus Heimdallarchaeota archaeon]MBY8994970.1 class IV adenylate cyclase [Candidatus Heimdallarchaeota archaeon]